MYMVLPLEEAVDDAIRYDEFRDPELAKALLAPNT